MDNLGEKMTNNYLKTASYILMAGAILFLFKFHLMTSLIGGMAVFLIVNVLHQWIGTKVHSRFAHKATVGIISVVVVSLLVLIGIGIYSGLSFGKANFANLSSDVLNIIQRLREYLPPSLVKYIPEDLLELKAKLTENITQHMPGMISATTSSVKGILHVIIGMLIGGVVAFSFLKDEKKIEVKGIAKEMLSRMTIFANVFQKVVFAQVKISFINTLLTGAYLMVALPLFGIDIPYAKTLVLLTFLFGLLPVIGNLMSNALIVLLSLMVSFEVAVASLVFLVVVHKLEYYVNAKITGEQIKTSIWEMLIVMLVLESVFGVIGAVLGPVMYGYLKEELRLHNMI